MLRAVFLLHICSNYYIYVVELTKALVGGVAVDLNFLYVHGNCTAVIRFFHESMHGNYPDVCKISGHVKYFLQTRIMHGIRLNHGYFIDFRRPPG